MHFDGDAFISYAHLDNQELVEGRKGWVANLHRALEIRVGQLLGKPPHIWRDPKLQGNDFFAETLIERLRRVAVLVAVVSPRYIRSEWTRKELEEFWKAAEGQGGVRIAEKARVFKVLKTPVPFGEQQLQLQGLLGYEFFRIDPETGKVRELDEVFGADAQREFWIKLDDLAHEICGLLERIEHEERGASAPPPAPALGCVYLAETTTDLREQRDVIRRDLQHQGYTVLPAEPLPHVAQEAAAAVRASLARCRMSIHLLGKSYSLVPEGGSDSLLEIQNELAIERGTEGDFSRLLWIPDGLAVTDPRQKAVLERIRVDPRIDEHSDVLETYLEDFRTHLQARLERARTPPPAPPAATATAASTSPATASQPAAASDVPSVYLLYDQRDADAAAAWADALFERRVEVLHPVFDGDERDIREYHDETLRTCDGVMIFFGAAPEVWLRRRMREVQKSAGYGRTLPPPALAICLVEPRTPEKDRFRTHEALVMRAWEADRGVALGPFLDRLRGVDGGRRG
jgi:hypothetical protein